MISSIVRPIEAPFWVLEKETVRLTCPSRPEIYPSGLLDFYGFTRHIIGI